MSSEPCEKCGKAPCLPGWGYCPFCGWITRKKEDSREVGSWEVRMRTSLFKELGILELYDSNPTKKCHSLKWTEVKILGDSWTVALCNREGKRKKARVGDRVLNLCIGTCAERKGKPIGDFFWEISLLMGKWKDDLIHEHLDMIEDRQCQRSVGIYLISD